MKKQKVLITGGTGSLGQALTRKLLKMDVRTNIMQVIFDNIKSE